ncbi:recombinase family protein [Cytophaga hutchinsonii]|uniref:Possible DNA-invertase from lambdoid prophage Qin n=1 Tax=Cytophaga hutchinsonii (strain ATCC 33406 / DSM 1761 / CIP 103989 / NBRC 15051 / NCIMB 9469 / D465) TaxID=269798 RepID=A0A6N4SM66_CYTH3|nr:recombinase family protein [Cytophaga hutchinsonii]ABG57344.1 possible DNA-invertase from lambdoid prophage Qin [Cytophaga hutchinsonii ATCC 33406]SFX46789.1 Site-specific DNA recombinase [Cytophaga hutchinsonii ATCC 33406]
MKTKVICLVRVSTQDQDYQRQISDLTKYSQARDFVIVDFISEKVSGTKRNEERNGIQELLKRARKKEFQKVIVQEISRLGRNPFQVQRVIEELAELSISVVVQNMNLETLDEGGNRNGFIDLMLSTAVHFSSIERSWIVNRIRSGQKNSKKKIGRPFNTFESKEAVLKKYAAVVRDLKSGISIRKVAKLNDLSTPTIQRVKKLMQEL